MKTEQIDYIYQVSNEEIITLNGIKAHVYPCSEGVVIDNHPFSEDVNDSWTELVVDYKTFINIVNNNDGNFNYKPKTKKR